MGEALIWSDGAVIPTTLPLRLMPNAALMAGSSGPDTPGGGGTVRRFGLQAMARAFH